jgi:hypothetical protein
VTTAAHGSRDDRLGSGRASWSLDFVEGGLERDAAWLGGFVRLELRPDDGVAWYWAYLVGSEVGLIVVRDHEVPLPRGDQLVVRADGLWAELVRETAGEHWSIGLEAFGVRLEDPADGFRGEVGERLAVGLDIEWEIAAASPGSDAGSVYGEVLVGRGRLALDATGTFREAQGAHAWTSTPGVEAELGRDGLPTRVAIGAEHAPVEVLALAAVPLGGARLVRVLGRWTGDDGAAKVGWVDLVEPE